MPPPKSPKVQTPKQHAQAAAKQILAEPFEILKTAGAQVTGGERQVQADSQAPQSEEQQTQAPISQEKVIAKRKKDASHIQAFQTELQEIKRLQEIRHREIQQLRQYEEQQKRQKQQQMQEQQSNSFIEPIAKIKKGVLGGVGKMMGVNKKQRSTELVKTPSN